MLYEELNLVNQIYISPLGIRRPAAYCPYEEIMDPHKVYQTIMNGKWDIHNIQGGPFFGTWSHWSRKWKFKGHGTVTSSGFYTFTDIPQMFHDLRKILEGGPMSLRVWFQTYRHTIFAMTSPLLLYLREGQMISRPYCINNRYPVQKIPLFSSSDYLAQLIMAQCYTIGNGLTLLLALHRCRVFSAEEVLEAIANVDLQNDFQEVPTNWHSIYYGHIIPHVADFPGIYANMGRNPAHPRILDKLTLLEEEPLQQIGTNTYGIFTSVSSVAFQKYERNRFDELYLEGAEWPSVPIEMDEDDLLLPNIGAFIQGVIQTRGSWRWYRENKDTLLNKLLITVADIDEFLNGCFYLYKGAKEHQHRLKYSRIRQLWLDIIEFDKEFVSVRNYMFRSMVKQHLIHHLQEPTDIIPPSYPEIPFAFLKDAFQLRASHWKVYLPKMIHVISYRMTDVAPLLERIGVIEHLGDTEARFKSTLIRLFQHMPESTLFHKFFQNMLEKRILTKLACIARGFGMRENQEATVTCSKHVNSLHLVGFLCMDYLQNHKNEMIL